ncbi:YesL family protein [Aquibacillus albus]|uniref:Membrane protein YesL n=1 Tax=Aquibacillus albus TaxID=1168171 RepID=A0ABS2MY48_9BACI|nr:DUF624 domain-containing protein [Aquibacillus albus]MBM7570814.1 putative membrane protein YesL [Aquibacillus albus]
MNGVMGGFYKISEWIMRFTVVNLCWVFFNLPIVFFIVNMLLANQLEDLIILSIPIILLAPFLFFPATAAMFASVRDWVLEKESSSLIKSYWKYYKENYKKSLLGGLLLTMIWSILVIDFYYLKDINVILMFAFIVLGIVLFVYTINFFSVIVHYDIKLRAIFKNTFLLTIGSPILFFAVLISAGIILYISVNGPLFLIPFFSGSLIAFICFSAFYRLFLKLTHR